MNSATDKLRTLLDGRGVEWQDYDGEPTWVGDDGEMYYARQEFTFAGLTDRVTVYHLTPEQAVAATCGAGTCKRVFYEPTGVYVCSECGCGLSKKLDKYCYLNYCPNCGRKVIAE